MDDVGDQKIELGNYFTDCSTTHALLETVEKPVFHAMVQLGHRSAQRVPSESLYFDMGARRLDFHGHLSTDFNARQLPEKQKIEPNLCLLLPHRGVACRRFGTRRRT